MQREQFSNSHKTIIKYTVHSKPNGSTPERALVHIASRNAGTELRCFHLSEVNESGALLIYPRALVPTMMIPSDCF